MQVQGLEEIAARGRADAIRNSPRLVPLTIWVRRRDKETLRMFARATGSSVSCQARQALTSYAADMYDEAAAIVQRHYDEAYADASRELEAV